MEAKVANMETKRVGIRDRKTVPERRALEPLLCIFSPVAGSEIPTNPFGNLIEQWFVCRVQSELGEDDGLCGGGLLLSGSKQI